MSAEGHHEPMNEQNYNEPIKSPVAERNRLNGMKSHGPTTEAGRLQTDLSKVTHGIRCERPVVPGVEQPEDWETHYASLRAALDPEGDFEELLVYRIALNFWRLGRVIRAENAEIQESAERVRKEIEDREQSGSLGDIFISLKRRKEATPEQQAQELLREAELKTAQRLVPYEADLNRFVIYERQLESSIRSNLHELQRLQAARAGQICRAPLVVDVSVTGSKPDLRG
jgi:hypothetical protein